VGPREPDKPEEFRTAADDAHRHGLPVAQELDTGAASLYVYVRNTAELHAAMLEQLLDQVDLSPVTRPPSCTYRATCVNAIRPTSGQAGRSAAVQGVNAISPESVFKSRTR
jgi:hypothetical protein